MIQWFPVIEGASAHFWCWPTHTHTFEQSHAHTQIIIHNIYIYRYTHTRTYIYITIYSNLSHQLRTCKGHKRIRGIAQVKHWLFGAAPPQVACLTGGIKGLVCNLGYPVEVALGKFPMSATTNHFKRIFAHHDFPGFLLLPALDCWKASALTLEGMLYMTLYISDKPI